MKKIYLLFTLNVFSLTIIAQSPITLGNSNMPGANDTLRYTNVAPNSVGNYTQTGTNYNWNFGSVVSTSEGLREFKSASATPYFIFFLSSGEYGEKIADTLVGGTGTISITKVYNYYKKQTSPVNAYIADGMGMTISGLPVPSYYTDKDELYNFPMTYPKYDSTTFKFSTIANSILPITYTKAGYRTTIVDGWGTITTPYGTENCLRLITTQYSRDTTMVTLPLPGVPPIKIGINNFVRSYQWMTLTSKIPYFEVAGNLIGNNFTVTQARYRGYKKEATGIESNEPSNSFQVYPNPVQNLLWMKNFPAFESLEILSIDGKLVQKAEADVFGSQKFIDVSGLSPGIYLLKLEQGGEAGFMKFVKE